MKLSGKEDTDRDAETARGATLAGKTLAALLLLTLFLAPGAVAGEPSPEINPALRYYQAMLLEPKFEPSEIQYLFGTEWRGRPLEERFDRLVAKYDGCFTLLKKAAQARVPCDWGVDPNDGPAMVMPRLAPAKHLVQVARLRVRWHLENGRQDEACNELLAALALGRNLAPDGLGISTLVQFSIDELVVWTVAQNFFAFTPETQQQIADGLDAAPARGTVAASIPKAENLFCTWYLIKIEQFQRENPGNDAKVLERIRNDLFRPTLVSQQEAQSDLPDRLIAAGGGTSAGVASLIRALQPLYQELARIMALPFSQYGPSFKAFKVEIERLPNPLAPRLLNYDRSRQSEFGTAVQLAMVRAAIAHALHGEQGFKTVIDPCANGPFAMERFVFEGVDRGFELRSSYKWNGREPVLIFVQADGKPFTISGPNAGQPVLDPAETMRLRYGLTPAPNAVK